MNRFLHLTGDNPAMLTLAALVLFTLPGPPIVYYGTEAGVTQERAIHDGLIGGFEEARLPMKWDAKQDSRLVDVFRRLIALRRSHPMLWNGVRQGHHLPASIFRIRLFAVKRPRAGPTRIKLAVLAVLALPALPSCPTTGPSRVNWLVLQALASRSRSRPPRLMAAAWPAALPAPLQLGGDQAVGGVHLLVAAAGQGGLIAGAFQALLPVAVELLAFGLGLLRGGQRQFKLGRLHGGEQQGGDGRVHVGHAEALAAGLRQGARVRLADVDRLVPVARVQRPAAASTEDKALQQSQAPLANGNRSVVSTAYNALGQVAYSGAAYEVTGAVGSGYMAPTWTGLANYTYTTYDELGRTVRNETRSRATQLWATRATYDVWTTSG